ncbi:MAG: DUF3421 domain-containing protein [Acidobacteriota bacterium]
MKTSKIKWTKEKKGTMPQDAFQGGQEANGSSLYVARASYGGGVQIGKMRKDWQSAAIPYGGKENWVDEYEIFVGAGVWVPAAAGVIPRNAMPAGQEANGEILYVARANYGGGMHIGKIKAGWKAAMIPYGGREVPVSQYEVLIEDSKEL